MADHDDTSPQAGRLAALQSGPGPKRFTWLLSEFLVVVMGVLVAITIDGWWSDRQDRERETVYLQQLANDLARSEAELADVSAFIRSLAVASANVTKAFWDPSLRERPDMLEQFTRPHRSTRYLPITGTARALVNSGNIDLVRSPRIRGAIIEYLEDVDASVRNLERFDETYFRPARFIDTELNLSMLAGLRYQRDGIQPGEQMEPERMALLPYPDRIESIPFEAELAKLFTDEAVYDRYVNLLTAHRNQHYIYEQLREQAGALLALLAEEGIAPGLDPSDSSAWYKDNDNDD